MVETVSTFAKKVRSGTISADDFDLVRRRFFADLRRRRPAILRVLVRHYQDADRLLAKYGFGHALHTLDAIQLAVALEQSRKSVPAELVVFQSSIDT